MYTGEQLDEVLEDYFSIVDFVTRTLLNHFRISGLIDKRRAQVERNEASRESLNHVKGRPRIYGDNMINVDLNVRQCILRMRSRWDTNVEYIPDLETKVLSLMKSRWGTNVDYVLDPETKIFSLEGDMYAIRYLIPTIWKSSEKRMIDYTAKEQRENYLKIFFYRPLLRIVGHLNEGSDSFLDELGNLEKNDSRGEVAHLRLAYKNIASVVDLLELILRQIEHDFSLLVIDKDKTSLLNDKVLDELYPDREFIGETYPGYVRRIELSTNSDTVDDKGIISIKVPNESGEKRNKPSLPANSLQILFWALSKNAFFNRAVEQQGIQAAYEILTGYKGTQLKKVIGSSDITSVSEMKVSDFNRLIRKLEEVVSQLKEHRDKFS